MQTLARYVPGVVHGINNPSHAAMMSAEMLGSVWNGLLPLLDRYQEEKGDFAIGGLEYEDLRVEVPRLLGAIIEGVERIREVAWSLKYFVRNGEPEEDAIRIDEVLRSVELLARDALRKRTSRFDVDCAPDLPELQGDGKRLVHALLELLRAATDVLPGQQVGIAVTASHEGPPSEVVLAIGIGEADPGFHDRMAEGDQYGLAVVNRILEDFRGRLSVESTPGTGARVSVALPVHPAQPGHSSP